MELPDFDSMNLDALREQTMVFLRSIRDRDRMCALCVIAFAHAHNERRDLCGPERKKYDEALKKQTKGSNPALHLVKPGAAER
ncbi:MAG TPA: hypothetical protein VMT62_07430 [Syntrophorhabdaceae bacterium]|nr:hypothetical protein [Syntrophorhabdaceae bacterium]